MQEQLRTLRKRRADGDRGFTMIELLVVVVIIGVLVAIAIPLYMNYRKGAENKAAQSDVRNAVVVVEQCYTDNANAYPTGGTQTSGVMTFTGCATGKANVSDGVTLTYTPTGTPPTSYQVKATHASGGATYTYDSATGQTVKS
jgi:type IV pilus assembly protein PilA